MFLSITHILASLEHYKYLLIFPIAVFEGPIIIIVSGFLVFLGYLNPLVAFVVLVVADTIGDALHYLVGKYGQSLAWVRKLVSYLGYNDKNKELLQNHFDKHRAKTFILAKFSHGVGGIIQIAAGAVGVDFTQFLLLSITGTIPKTLLLLIVGYYIGDSYEKINGYLHLIAFIFIGAFVLGFIYMMSRRFVKDFIDSK